MTEYRVTSILANVTEPNAVNQIPDLKDFSDKLNVLARDGWKLAKTNNGQEGNEAKSNTSG